MGYRDTLNTMYHSRRKALDDYFSDLYKLVAQEPNGGEPSVPGNFSNSANLLKEVVDVVNEVHDGLVSLDNDRKNNWRGPAADIYGSLVTAVVNYLDAFKAATVPD